MLVIPKNVKLDISDIVNNVKLLPAAGGRIEENKETVYKLNNVSETISEMARSYNEVAVASLEVDEDIDMKNKRVFGEELLNNIEEFSNNFLYEDLIDQDDIIIDDIYDFLVENETITKEELLHIFEKNNSYIIGIDDEDVTRKKEIEDDIEQIVKAVNYTFKINKLNLIWKQKEAANKKTLANQLGGVSKVISSLADDIEKVTEDKEEKKITKEKQESKFKIQIGVAKATKNGEEVSGDSSLKSKLHDGKYMLAISDGMGSRTECQKK